MDSGTVVMVTVVVGVTVLVVATQFWKLPSM